MSDFPEEVTRKIDSFGGLVNFIFANKRFAVVAGRILCNAEDHAKATAMASSGSGGRAPSSSLPTSIPQQPASELGSRPSDLENKKPAFSWEARARQLSQASPKKSQTALLPAPTLSHASPWNSSEPANFQNSEKEDFPAYASLDTLPKAWKDLCSNPHNSESASDDGFITVSKKKSKGTSEAGVSSGILLNHQVNPPLPVMKNRGPNFLARAEAAAKLDLSTACKIPDQNTIASKDRPLLKESALAQGRSVRDDMSDVTTHSSDSVSVMDLIEELNASEPSLTGSVNSIDKSDSGLSGDRLSSSNVTR